MGRDGRRERSLRPFVNHWCPTPTPFPARHIHHPPHPESYLYCDLRVTPATPHTVCSASYPLEEGIGASVAAPPDSEIASYTKLSESYILSSPAPHTYA